MPGGTHWATASATLPAGNTSYRGCSSSGATLLRPPRNGPPQITASPASRPALGVRPAPDDGLPRLPAGPGTRMLSAGRRLWPVTPTTTLFCGHWRHRPHTVSGDQQLQFPFQAAGPGVHDGERQPEPGRHPPRLRLEVRVPVLGQPDHPAVVPEVIRPQF